MNSQSLSDALKYSLRTLDVKYSLRWQLRDERNQKIPPVNSHKDSLEFARHPGKISAVGYKKK